MRIRYNGEGPVDPPGHSFVSHGDVIEVPDDVGASLLLAGSTVDEDNNVVYADDPLWSDAEGMPLSPTFEERRAALDADAADESLGYKPLTNAQRKAAEAAAEAAAQAATSNDPPADETATSTGGATS